MVTTCIRRFVQCRAELDTVLANAKAQPCPYCKRRGTLNGHGFVYGYGPGSASVAVTGRRLYCSSRRKRPGCGRTFMVALACQLWGRVATTMTLWALLNALLKGQTLYANERLKTCGLSLRSLYRLRARLVFALPQLRTSLLPCCAPPPSGSPDPLVQLAMHLLCAFPGDDPVRSWQMRFQTSIEFRSFTHLDSS